jgi:general secretion pathway protein I
MGGGAEDLIPNRTYPDRESGATGTPRASARRLNLPRSCRSGFTLVEVLVAVAVLSIGLVAVVGSYNRSLSAMGTAVSAAEATAALEETMWLVKGDPEKYLREGEGPVGGRGGNLYWKVERRPQPQGLSLGDPLQHVWVGVRWREGGTWRSIGASTLVWSPTAPLEEASE